MAAYDKDKLLGMIEARRRAHLALTDLGDRAREAKSEANRLRGLILEKAAVRAQQRGHIDRLLQTPYDEACRLTTAEIQEYTHRQRADDAGIVLETGVNAETYRRFIARRERAVRLSEEHAAAAQDFHARFGIVPKLIDWVRERGFRNPELEV
ncbi:MAG: hypothetical protein IT468_01650 [Rhodocyclaceae bacterium]|nr:hypothetical protein [Rhodocyclaceae bacterium]